MDDLRTDADAANLKASPPSSVAALRPGPSMADII